MYTGECGMRSCYYDMFPFIVWTNFMGDKTKKGLKALYQEQKEAVTQSKRRRSWKKMFMNVNKKKLKPVSYSDSASAVGNLRKSVFSAFYRFF